MSTSNLGSDPLEQRLRESLAQYEVPYNSADWKDLERTLDSDRRGWWLGATGLAMIAGIATLVGGGIWFAARELNSSDPGSNVITQEAPPVGADINGSGTPHGTGIVASEALNGKDADVPRETSHDPGTRAVAMVVNPEPVVDGKARNSGAATKSSSANGAEATARNGRASEVDVTKTEGAPSADRAFRSSVSEACSGTSVAFKVERMPENGIYLWNFGDGSFSNKANPEHTFSKPGRYQVMLSMSAAGVGSIQNKPSSDVIEIHEAPSAAFNVLRQEYEGHLPSVHFENRSLGGDNYVWDFGDGETSTIAHPDHIYKSKGVYQVKLTVTNAIGCEDQIMKDVRVDKDYNLDAPASFSPNGDGRDESFIPEALRSLGVKFNLTIYSPNGNLLYQTNDATKPWTGRPSNRGDICPAGEYVWVVDVRESLHLAETYTGKVKLER